MKVSKVLNKNVAFNHNVNKLCIDSRNIKVNDIFFAIKGSKTDGNLYVKDSFYYPVKVDEIDKLRIVVQIFRGVDLVKSNKVGNLIVLFDEEEIFREDLLIDKDDDFKKSFFDKVKDFFLKIF